MGQLNIRADVSQIVQTAKPAKSSEKRDVKDDFKSLIENSQKDSTDKLPQEKDSSVKQNADTAGDAKGSSVEDSEASAENENLVQNAYLFGAWNLQVQQMPEEQETMEMPEVVEVAAVTGEDQVLMEVPGEAVPNAEQFAEPDEAQAENLQNVPIEVQTQQTAAVNESGVQKAEKKPEMTGVSDPTENLDRKDAAENADVTGALQSQMSAQHTAQTVQTEKSEVFRETVAVREPEELPQKLAEQLIVKTENGAKELEIQLAPEHLGKIAVKIEYREGQTTVSILCSEKRTMELLGQRAGEIGAVMEQNLGKETTIIVEEPKESDYTQNQNGNEHAGKEAQQEKQKEQQNKQSAGDAEQFLQKLRLGLQM